MRPLKPGYRRIEFRPEVPGTGLYSVAVSYESKRGVVASRWRRSPDGLEFDVTLPPIAVSVVYVPALNVTRVVEGRAGATARANRAPGVRLLRTEPRRIVYEVTSGHYLFRVSGSPAR